MCVVLRSVSGGIPVYFLSGRGCPPRNLSSNALYNSQTRLDSSLDNDASILADKDEPFGLVIEYQALLKVSKAEPYCNEKGSPLTTSDPLTN